MTVNGECAASCSCTKLHSSCHQESSGLHVKAHKRSKIVYLACFSNREILTVHSAQMVPTNGRLTSVKW